MITTIFTILAVIAGLAGCAGFLIGFIFGFTDLFELGLLLMFICFACIFLAYLFGDPSLNTACWGPLCPHPSAEIGG